MHFITKSTLCLITSIFFEAICIFQGFTSPTFAQTQELSVQDAAVKFQQRTKLIGSTSPLLANVADVGRASGNDSLQGVTFLLSQTQSQIEALQKLVINQQVRGSRYYHKWLTPQEYSAQFGMKTADVAKIEAWLTTGGFSHFTLNASHTALSFDGSVTQIEETFSTEIHKHNIGKQLLLANVVDLEIPSDILPFVSGVTNLDQFRPVPQVSSLSVASAHPDLTSTYNRHFLSPADVKKIYDFDPLFIKGFTGQGQRIAVVGQSSIDLEDVARFRAAIGLAVRQPTLVLVPDTGSSLRRTGDELESDIDLEYSSAVAPDADIFLVYTGSDASHNVFDALAYAVDQNIAPVISVSYGECETSLSGSELQRLESVLMQANSQGETVLVASGDLGATGCETVDSQAQGLATHGFGVQYPASSQFVTSIGGTMLINTDATSYWTIANTIDEESALSYIPEQAWNESYASAKMSLLGSGGGASSLFAKPTWQIASGVPSDGARDLPDVAIDAGTYDDGYVLCSSDEVVELQGSCSHGLLDSTNSNLTVAGGTSFGAPIVAGIVALINQSLGVSRLGNLNSLLYSLSIKAPNMFHDIVIGNNQQPCATGSKDCSDSGTIGYVATDGYDQVTGLGTPDVGMLAVALAASANKTEQQATITLRQIESVAYTDQAIHVIAVISSPDGAPSGPIQFSLDEIASGSTTVLQNGTAEYTFYSSIIGTHHISAIFVSTSTNASIMANITIDIKANPSAIRASFSLENLPLDAVTNYATTSRIMISPLGLYSGKVIFQASTSSQDLIRYGCYSIKDVAVQTSIPTYTTLFVARSRDMCKALSSSLGVPVRPFSDASLTDANVKLRPSALRFLSKLSFNSDLIESGTVMFLGAIGRKRKFRLTWLAPLIMTTFCTGCSVMSTSEQAMPGTYVVIVSGIDTTHAMTSTSISLPLLLK